MHQKYRRIQPQRLRFPPHLTFTSVNNGLLKCNDKLVQVIPSLPINASDNPPTDLTIFGFGIYEFILNDADVYIFSFVNIQTKKTDCAIIKKDELVFRLKPYHYSDDKINIKLFLTDRGLHECYGAGAEAFFISIWNYNSYNKYYNNWLVFNI